MKADLAKTTGKLFVHRIQEMREEIRRAMAAISSNELGALEESLWRQEVLCTGMKQLLRTARQAQPGPALATELRTSLRALYYVNLSYAELVRQSQASNHLIYALCAAHAAKSDRPAVTPRCSLEA